PAHGTGQVGGPVPPRAGLRTPDPDDDAGCDLPEPGEGDGRRLQADRIRVLRWMMARIGFTEELVAAPSGVTLLLQGDEVLVTGKLGALRRRLSPPRVALSLDGAELRIRSDLPGRREKAVVGTFAAHVRN